MEYTTSESFENILPSCQDNKATDRKDQSIIYLEVLFNETSYIALKELYSLIRC